MTTQFNYIHLLLLAFTGGFAILLYLNFPLGYNQSLYHYQGLVMLQGGLPYTDFIEKKGPMGLLTYGLAAIIFDPSPLSYRLFDLLLQSVTGVMLFLTLRRVYPISLSIMVPVIWLAHTLIDGPGNTADVTNIITLSLVGTLYLLGDTLNNRIYWWLGILMGVACWVKPTAFLMFLPVWYYVYKSNKQGKNSVLYSAFLKVAGGVAAVSITFILYLLITASWEGFWEALVLDPLLNYVDDRDRLSWRVLKRIGYIFTQDPLFRVAGVAGLVLFTRNNITSMSLLFCGSILLMILIEGKHFPYHFSPLWPFLAIGLHHLFYVTIEKIKGHPKLKTSLLALAIIVFSYPLIFIGNRFVEAGFLSSQDFDPGKTFLLKDFRDMYYGRQEMVKYLKNHFKEGDTIFALGSDPNIYLEVGQRTKCRFAREGLMLAIDNVPDYLRRWQEELVTYMVGDQPDWLIIDNTVSGVLVTRFKVDINALLKTSYDNGKVMGGYTLYHKI